VQPSYKRVATGPDGGDVLDASWPSAWEPFHPALREKLLAHGPNRTAHARLHLAPTARPAVILIHGYLGGRMAIEERAWPIGWMQRRGLDVALPVLPFHAQRNDPGGGPPRFPGADPRYSLEGFRQAVADLRVLAALLRDRGGPAVGVMGMSLGGYTSALLATLDDFAFAVPIIPLASLADFARDHGRLSPAGEGELEHRALDQVYRPISPFTRPSRVAAERLLVVGGEADQITPIAQAERLARHLGAPLHRLPGGHLLQLGRGQAFRAVGALWRRIGLI
jgi:pimeloyl-ACP methyl ester carboxylesterase